MLYILEQRLQAQAIVEEKSLRGKSKTNTTSDDARQTDEPEYLSIIRGYSSSTGYSSIYLFCPFSFPQFSKMWSRRCSVRSLLVNYSNRKRCTLRRVRDKSSIDWHIHLSWDSIHLVWIRLEERIEGEGEMVRNMQGLWPKLDTSIFDKNRSIIGLFSVCCFDAILSI